MMWQPHVVIWSRVAKKIMLVKLEEKEVRKKRIPMAQTTVNCRLGHFHLLCHTFVGGIRWW